MPQRRFPHLDPTVERYLDSAELAVEYDEYFAGSNLFAYDEQFLAKRLRPGMRVLDIGCGTGRHIFALSHIGCKFIGLDMSPHMLEEARDKLALAGLSAGLVRADMLRPPFAASVRFDAILLMFSTLGLVFGAKERIAFISRLGGFLEGGGSIFVHVHNDKYRRHLAGGWKDNPAAKLPELARQALGLLEPGDHLIRNYRGVLDLRLHSFTLREIGELASQSGLRLLHLEGLNDRRDAPYAGKDADNEANGFIFELGKPG